MRTIPITIMVRSDGIDVTPTFANVKNGNDDVKLRWIAIGGTFPGTDCFSWKPGVSGAPAVTCSAGNVLESAAYKNDDANQRVWGYTVTIAVDGKNVTIDPEVNNEPPGTKL